MGYTTVFTGAFKFTDPLTSSQVSYINGFADTRRMMRDPEKAEQLADDKREDVGLPIGENGCYFTGGLGFMGQEDDVSVLERNAPPPGQPGLWCPRMASEDGKTLQWDESEKFYDYKEWLEYLILHFFHKWGCVLNGEVAFQGEDPGDAGVIRVVENLVTIV